MSRRRLALPAATAPRAARWAALGAALGIVAAAVVFAPAAWLASGLARATGDRLLLADARGTVWQGSAVLVLTGGLDSRDASALPGRLAWRLSPSLTGGPGLALRAEQPCCLNGSVTVLARPGFGRLALELLPAPGWIGQWPAAWLEGLGTPWNTLQPGGRLQLQSRGLTAESVQGRWRLTGGAEIELQNLSSRLSTLPVLGSYRLRLEADPTGAATLNLNTLEGVLQLVGSGQWGAGGLRLRGEARAATPADEAALVNLLNIIGRRQGARSVISIG